MTKPGVFGGLGGGNYLAERQKTREELLKENHSLGGEIDGLTEQVARLRADNARLREALEFYAEDGVYDMGNGDVSVGDMEAWDDHGWRARRALGRPFTVYDDTPPHGCDRVEESEFPPGESE